MSETGKYIYGIIEETQPKSFSFSGVGGAPVYAIINQRLAAIVSDTELTAIDPTRKNIYAHTVVQDELLREYAVLPANFGMIARNGEEVSKLLEKNRQGLFSELERLTGKVEVALRVFWNQEAVIKELQDQNQELTRLRANVNSTTSPLEARSLLIKAGKLVEDIVQGWQAKYAGSVYGVLGQISLEAKMNKLLGIQNILNASFLINKSNESEFRTQVYRLDAQYQNKLNFKYVAPLPPYNFINIRLEPVV